MKMIKTYRKVADGTINFYRYLVNNYYDAKKGVKDIPASGLTAQDYWAFASDVKNDETFPRAMPEADDYYYIRKYLEYRGASQCMLDMLDTLWPEYKYNRGVSYVPYTVERVQSGYWTEWKFWAYNYSKKGLEFFNHTWKGTNCETWLDSPKERKGKMVIRGSKGTKMFIVFDFKRDYIEELTYVTED